MTPQMLATRDLLFTRIAVFENGKLVEYFLEPKHFGGLVGNVFIGKVSRILPGVDCAFIDIGLDRDGFLYEGDMCQAAFCERRCEGSSKKKHSITNLRVGDPILVQVTKEPMGQKGPRLSTQISLPGNYLVYMPLSNRVGASKKLSDGERTRLKEIMGGLKGDFTGGFISRTAAESASKEELAFEMQNLAELWNLISLKRSMEKPPALLHQEADLPLKAVREILLKTKGELITDDEELADIVNECLSGVKDTDISIKLWKNKQSLFEEYKVDQELETASRARVWLPSGGCIVVQPTEALVAIDVNSGRYVGKRSLEDTAFKTNIEAAEEIVRQLRLRNLGGIIVIDFIDMTEKQHREQVVQKLQEFLKADKAKSRILKISEFGLVEMTRKRTHKPLEKIYYTSCPCCEGKGKVAAPWRIVSNILGQLSRVSPHKKYKVKISTYVHRFIEENREILPLPDNVVFEEEKLRDPARFELMRLDAKSFSEIVKT